MVASTGDYRPLLSGGVWLAGSAAVVACLYGISASSSIAIALGFELVLLALSVWAARDLQRKRDFIESNANRIPLESPPGSTPDRPPIETLQGAIQSQAMVIGIVAVIVGLFAILQLLQLTPSDDLQIEDGAVLGIVCLTIAFVWLVFARSFQSIRESDFPEAPALSSAFREVQWGALVAATGLMGIAVEPLLVFWVTRLLLIWVMAICAEMILRLLVTLLIPADPNQAAVSPIQLLLREAIFTATNPIASLIRTFENRCGVSLRSSWAISFVRRTALPLLVLLMLLSWGLTSLVIVETHQMAVREHFGRVSGGPLLPGLQWMLPWPFGRIRAFPVKNVRQLPIGFIEADDMSDREHPRALLWTKPHAKEEFSLVLGDGSEFVAVNALVYFKISEDPPEFFDYVYRQAESDEALVAFAYRALMEETRGRTLDDVLSVNRAAFARRVVDSVRQQSQAARLGLDVVDLALLNMHPPIEAGGSYLDVINARLDARRRVNEAEGEKQVALLDAESRGAMAVSSAKMEGSRRVAQALGEVSEFKAVGEALQVAPRTFRLRLWIEALESALAEQRLFLVDHTVLDEGGELMLDTRPFQAGRLRLMDAPSPDLFPGANRND